MKRVLIVDDEPDILLMLRLNLESEGYATALAPDGESALRHIVEDPPDLVILDVMMPVMDGWSVLDSLTGGSAAPRVIVVSAKSNPRDIVRAIESGADDYVVKPFDPDDLLRMIEWVLGASSAELDEHRRALLERHSS